MKTALSLALVPAILLALGGAPERRLSVRIVDAATGEVVPAMVCITGPDGKVRLPPDGRAWETFTTTEEFFPGISFDPDPDWIGPVRPLPREGDKGPPFPSLPHWREPAIHWSSGNFSIRLPEGRVRIAVDRGLEYVPLVEEFELSGDVEKTVTMKRWINLSREGWWSGDIHVHHPILTDAHADYLLEYARASDLHVVNAVTMGDDKTVEFRQRGYDKVRRGDFVLVPGQEDPRSVFGHVLGLNLSSEVRDLGTYDWYDVTFKGIHAQPGALVGHAHFSNHAPNVAPGFSLNLASGELDFVEILQFQKFNPQAYYDVLNLGFRVAAAAGSDVPWGTTLGEVRTYVYTGDREKLDVDGWFRAMKAGRTFVTNGPALELTVDGELPGTVLQRKKGDVLKVRARASGPSKIVALHVVSAEGPVREGEVDLVVDRSRWIAAVARCENGAVAQTSPVYVEVDGRPTWCPDRGPALADRQIEVLESLRKSFPGDDLRARGIQERIDRAVQFYRDLKSRMATP